MPMGQNIRIYKSYLKLRNIRLMKISDYPKWQNAEKVRETDGNILKDNKQYKTE